MQFCCYSFKLKDTAMKKHILLLKEKRCKDSNIMGVVMTLLFVIFLSVSVAGQNSLPAPGSGGRYRPNLGPSFGPPNGIGWNPGPTYPGNWGSPWYQGWYNDPTVMSPTITTGLSDQGITKVVACGYDAQGIWRVLPLTVSYQYNGVQYIVNVLNAWNPWTDQWDRGVDTPAFNTDYYLRGVEYSYYTVLSTGTFYFNL